MKTRPLWNAADYSAHSSAQLGWGSELVEKLHLRQDEHVLDIGCGDGKITAAIAQRVPGGRVVGVDSSQSMVEHARQEHAPTATNLTFLQMDASTLAFDNEFDAVFSNAALHWVFDHAPILKGIHHALKPGGRVLLQMGGRGNAADVIATADTVRRADRWAEYFTGFTFPYGFHGPDEYREWLIAAGLQPVRVELISKDMVHTPRDFESWIRTTWLPYTQRVPDGVRDEFIGEFMALHLDRHPPESDGLVHTAMKRLEVEAVKGEV